MNRTIIISPILIFLVFIMPVGGSLSLVASAQVEDVTTQKIAGKLIRVEGNRYTIDTPGGAKDFSLENAVSVMRDGQAIAVTQLQVNDEVTAEVSSDGRILSIESTSPQAQNNNRNLMLATGAAVIGLVILLIVLSRTRKQSSVIKTMPATE